MPENTDSNAIIKLAQGHIAILIDRNWPAIGELLDESEEVTVNAKIVITERTPEAGEHSDVDHRVKTTISFSKKVSDSTESALEDPNSAPLRCPHDKTLDEYCKECADVAQERGNVFVPPPVNPEHHPETGESAAETREAAAVIKDAAEPIGTSLGTKLDAAAIQQKAPQFVLDLDGGQYGGQYQWTPKGLTQAFRQAAKKAGWTVPQISALADILKGYADVPAMIQTLRPFVIAEEEQPMKSTVIVVDGSNSYEVPFLDAELPDGFPLEKVLHTFVVAAREANWPKEAITFTGNEAERQARVIGDEPEATETATRYLRSFCVSK